MSPILIVEDNQILALTLEKTLADRGFYVIRPIAETTPAAWALALRHQPHVIIIDVHLEERYAGLELAAKLMSTDAVVIITTFDASDETFAQARDLKPFAYLTKPFSPKHLVRTVELAISAYGDRIDRTYGSILGKNHTGEIVQIPISKLTVIEAIGNYCYLQMGKQRYSVRSSLSRFMDQLPEHLFVRLNRSHAVAISSISSINLKDNEVVLADQRLPIGGRYKKEVVKHFRD